MKKIIFSKSFLLVVLVISLILVFATTVLGASFTYTPLPTGSEADKPPKELLIKFKSGISKEQKSSFKKEHSLTVTERINQLEVEEVKLQGKADIAQKAQEYSTDPRVEYAEPNYRAQAILIPNDPIYPIQWNLPKISAPGAWEITTGKPIIKIAIVDTGVNTTHTDLDQKIVPGYDFVNHDNDPSDDNGHGTYCAGIAAAETNNGIGIAGLDWQAKIMPVKVLDENGSGDFLTVAKGIIYAAKRRAKVINLSLGAPYPSKTLQKAINYAYSKGSTIIAAGGNTGTTAVYYPAGCRFVIGVGATDENDNKAWFSNYNSSIDVVAPGVWIASTYLPHYAIGSGTSASAAHVSGLAALILSTNCRYRPWQVEKRIKNSADDLGTPGRDDLYGYGRINAQRAVASKKMSKKYHWPRLLRVFSHRYKKR